MIDLAHQHYQGGRLPEELEAKLAAARLAGSAAENDPAHPDPAALAELAQPGEKSP